MHWICFVDCHLVHYGHEEVVRAITNIAEPEYEKVIWSLPQPPPSQQQPPQPVPGTSATMEPTGEPTGPPFQAGKQGRVPQDPSKTLLGKANAESVKVGFLDMWETQWVKEYLILNGNYRLIQVSTASTHQGLFDYIDSALFYISTISLTLPLSFQVHGYNRCLYTSVRHSLNIQTLGYLHKDLVYFPNRYLRHQVVMYLVQQRAYFLATHKLYLLGQYTGTGGDLNHFPTNPI